MRENIICAGFGGQGIMLLGKFIAFIAMKRGFHTTWMPSYGAEVRGGTAYCMVTVSDEEISSPVFTSCDIAIIMNDPSLEKYLSYLKPGGMLILNSSMAGSDIARKDITALKVPITDMAHGLGNARVANIIALGVYLKAKNISCDDVIMEGLNEAFPGKKELVELNLRALKEGMNAK